MPNPREFVEEFLWREVPQSAKYAAKASLPEVKSFLARCEQFPAGEVFYNPTYSLFAFSQPTDALEKTAKSVPFSEMKKYAGVWLHVKMAGVTAQDVLSPVANTTGWQHNPVTNLMGGPNTLTAALGSGILGAGLGYGTGWVADKFLSTDPKRNGRLPKTLAVLGGAMGAAPALWAGYHGWFKDRGGDLAQMAYSKDNPFAKSSAFDSNGFDPSIPVDQFNQVIWQDSSTPSKVRAATSGLIEGASSLRSNANYVSPADIARIATGMGSGYLSGLVVGKTLGALAGLSDSAQNKLQQAGVWAGLLTNVVPMAFGQRPPSYMEGAYGS